ncbi:TetR family transcriptional regulator [Actinorhabdospora filicis]|uniref:TetR family transcriptional regulator n=1 Tax=Actinorhabdospora filicis TaxID=1785913 RepID=A0A9W6SSJ7_9ACTN|nr:TetR/AcrR family transcriptional regulator [Actinorhabdospora filicis]GLZ82094.1 TetR family transcriptional regulator [Actinorhabdospora filicis]
MSTREAVIGYHHGDLRRAIVDAAVESIAESGPSGWSLRELARRAGVSHAAPAHHFGDKAGVLTAVAAEGFRGLAASLAQAGDFLDLGLAYVAFATSHPAHFQVMFQPELYHSGDPDLSTAADAARAALTDGLRETGLDEPGMELAAWSIAHGFSALWVSGALPAELGKDPVAAGREVLARLLDGRR